LSGALDGRCFKEMILGAAVVLEQNKETLDALNVFPVPDGDTGTNMSLTMVTAAKEVAAISEAELDHRTVCTAMSLGALKGARGNSGVILSQIFAGFAAATKEMDGAFDATTMAAAFRRGTEFAYKAVMKPKEGTILTVISSMADAAELFAEKSKDVYEQLDYILREGEKTLKETPDMLPVLKEAGVVDAGGAGFLMIIMGFKSVLDGTEIDSDTILEGEGIADFTSIAVSDDIAFGYCTEFFIKNFYPKTQERDIDAFRNNLSKIGDSVLVVGDLHLIKTHVHTNEPGLALQYAQILGELSSIKIDNMREQHRELSDDFSQTVEEKKIIAVVAVSSGDGIRAIFSDWQIDGFVEGGQSMNPSIQDILKVVDAAPSDHVIILPNNKNIILAAEQAADLSRKDVLVVKSKSIPQGIAAAISYDPDADIHENAERMNQAIASVKTGLITNAVRDTKMNGNTIREGELIGIADGEIVVNSNDLTRVVIDLLSNMTDDVSEMLTIYYGSEAGEAEANALSEIVAKAFPELDMEMVYGGQPVYQYMISVE
jgi:DAK2 domain fusion protein YloV